VLSLLISSTRPMYARLLEREVETLVRFLE
jgi:hypothetical protein